MRRYVELLKIETEFYIRGFDHKGYLLGPVNWMQGIQTGAPRMFGDANQLKYL